MHLFYQPEISAGHLTEEDSRHAVKVLRLAAGDTMELTDGAGNLYTATIRLADSRKCTFGILQTISTEPANFSVHLAIAPTKNIDRIEWMIEKCVEIGIDTLSFIQCKTSERKSINMERMEKVVVSAMKQSRQFRKPTINSLLPFAEFIRNRQEKEKFIAHVDETHHDFLIRKATPRTAYLVMIGPEGDFTTDELANALEQGFQKVSLGPHRLRTETAGLASVLTLNILNQGF